MLPPCGDTWPGNPCHKSSMASNTPLEGSGAKYARLSALSALTIGWLKSNEEFLSPTP